MIISQHAFCPLGFLRDFHYNAQMVLTAAEGQVCSSLSPAFGHSFIMYRSVQGIARFFFPLFQVSGTFSNKVSLTDTFLYSRSHFYDNLVFYVWFLNF